jgi:hypothetical protein
VKSQKPLFNHRKRYLAIKKWYTPAVFFINLYLYFLLDLRVLELWISICFHLWCQIGENCCWYTLHLVLLPFVYDDSGEYSSRSRDRASKCNVWYQRKTLFFRLTPYKWKHLWLTSMNGCIHSFIRALMSTKLHSFSVRLPNWIWIFFTFVRRVIVHFISVSLRRSISAIDTSSTHRQSIYMTACTACIPAIP